MADIYSVVREPRKQGDRWRVVRETQFNDAAPRFAFEPGLHLSRARAISEAVRLQTAEDPRLVEARAALRALEHQINVETLARLDAETEQ